MALKTWLVQAVVRDHDGYPVGVYTDPSDARVRLIFIEEETKQPHSLVAGTLVLEGVHHEVADSCTDCACARGAR